jgi:hypothetical protein
MKVGDLVKNIRTGQHLVFLGLTGDSLAYHFWFSEFGDWYVSVRGWKPDKWEWLNESR